jgi:hypothetical protein
MLTKPPTYDQPHTSHNPIQNGMLRVFDGKSSQLFFRPKLLHNICLERFVVNP